MVAAAAIRLNTTSGLDAETSGGGVSGLGTVEVTHWRMRAGEMNKEKSSSEFQSKGTYDNMIESSCASLFNLHPVYTSFHIYGTK